MLETTVIHYEIEDDFGELDPDSDHYLATIERLPAGNVGMQLGDSALVTYGDDAAETVVFLVVSRTWYLGRLIIKLVGQGRPYRDRP
jgi:hypothetical protein